MPATLSLEDWYAQRDKSEAATAATALDFVSGQNPDERASALDTARATGAPVELVQQFKPIFDRKVQSIRNRALLSTAPTLSNWLRDDQNNAIVAQDDLEALSTMETIGQSGKELAKGVPGGAVTALGTVAEAGKQLTKPVDPKARRGLAQEISEAQKLTAEQLGELRQRVQDQGLANPQIAQGILSDVLEGTLSPDDALQALEPLFTPGLAAVSGGLGRAADDLTKAGQDMLPAREGWENSMSRQIGQGLGSLITLLAVSAATGPVGTAVTSGMMGAGEAAQRAKAEGQDEDMQAIAAFYGVFPGLTDVIPIERFMNNPVTRRFFGGMIWEMMRTGAVEGTQEAGQEFLQNVISKALYQPNQDLVANLANSFMSGYGTGGIAEAFKQLLGAALPGRVRATQQKAKDAETRKETFNKISETAQQSKLRARSPSKFAEFAQRVTKGTPVENTYVPAEAFQQYFQSKGVDPAQVIAELPGVNMEDYQVALKTGGDFTIPVADYAAYLTGSEHDEFFKDNAKFNPDQMTAAEAAEFNTRAQDALREAFDLAEEVRQEEEGMRAEHEVLRDKMVSQLRAAGRSTEVARYEAELPTAFFRAMADRARLTVGEMLAKHPAPLVRGFRPEGLTTKDDIAQTLTLVRRARGTRKQGKGPLLEFLERVGVKGDRGDLRVALDKDADAIIRDDGVGIDDAALRAMQEGLLGDSEMVSAYRAAQAAGTEVPDITGPLLEAVREEQEGVGTDPEAQKLADIENYLDKLGVSLENTDEEIRAKIEGAQKGVQYGQSAYHGTPHLFDKFSTEKIGTGEGAQVYGWGLYFAGKKEVAQFYREKLSGKEIRVFGLPTSEFPRTLDQQKIARLKEIYDANIGDLGIGPIEQLGHLAMGRVIGYLQDRIYKMPDPDRALADIAFDQDQIARSGTGMPNRERGEYQLRAAIARAMIGKVKLEKPGRIFEVDVPEDNELLAWDAPLSEQPDGVRKAIEDALTRQLNAANISEWEYAAWDRLLNDTDWTAFTGEDFYKAVGDRLSRDSTGERGSDARKDVLASEWFRTLGIPGHRYLDGGSRAAGDGTYNYVIYDDSRVAVKSYEQDRRGGITFMPDGQAVIDLFQKADLSTFIHESSHFFLKVFQGMSAEPNAEPGIAEDYAIIKNWWRENAKAVAKEGGVTEVDVIAALDNGTTGDAAKDVSVDRGMHEYWAKAFEQYAMDGKAPSIELRPAFERFRSWLLMVYRKLRGLGVNVSSELRGVFDRMLATDEQIERAQADVGDVPIFASAEQMGVSQEEYDALIKLHQKAEDAARTKLLNDTMEPLRREREKWFKDNRKAEREEQEKAVNAMPVYRAIEWMGNRRWLGEGKPADLPDFRLSKDILVQRYGLAKTETLPKGQFPVWDAKGGVDPDEAAGWFGFTSGDQMLQAMWAMPKRQEAIEAETERALQEKFGDPLRDGSVEERALAALHGATRGGFLSRELDALVEIAGTGRKLTHADSRESARRSLGNMRVRDIRPEKFLAAERKESAKAHRLIAQVSRDKVWVDAAARRVQTAARRAAGGKAPLASVAQAIEAYNARFETTQTTYEVGEQQRTSPRGKDYTIPAGERTKVSKGYNDLVAELVEAKRRQLLNYALYQEARVVREEVERGERLVKRLQKKSTQERLGKAGALEAVKDILDAYDFARMSGRQEADRAGLNAYVTQMMNAGRELEIGIPGYVLAEAKRQPYQTLKWSELRGVLDALRNIQYTAARANKILDEMRERDYNETVDAVTSSIDANLKDVPRSRLEEPKGKYRSVLNLLLNSRTIVREMDGFDEAGAVRDAIRRPIDEAETRMAADRIKVAEDMEKLFSVYSQEERRAMGVREYVPEIKDSISKDQRLAVALNMGNEGNYQRLTDTRVEGGYTEEQVKAIVSTLDERDARFVQSVGDYINSLRSRIAEREKRVKGVEPVWVDPRPFEIAGIELPGFYYPIAYDTTLPNTGGAIPAQELADAYQGMVGGRFAYGMTLAGWLKERQQAAKYALKLDLSIFPRHVFSVLHDLNFAEAVNGVNRILNDPRVESAMKRKGRLEDMKALRLWLQDTAVGDVKAAAGANGIARRLKSNFTSMKLAVNAITAFKQVTGIVQTAAVLGKRDTFAGIVEMSRGSISADDIQAMSPFMQERFRATNKDAFDYFNDPKKGLATGKLSDIQQKFWGPIAFYAMTKAQFYTVDVPSWLGGYRKGMRIFNNDQSRAIAFADDIVKRAQGSHFYADRTALERGTTGRDQRQNDWIRLVTSTLGSYMNTKLNVTYEQVQRAKLAVRRGDPDALKQVGSLTINTILVVAIDAMLADAIGNFFWLGDDDDKEVEDYAWLKWMASTTALNAIGMVPVLRDLNVRGYGSGGVYASIGDVAWEPVRTAFSEGASWKTFTKATIDAAGLATGAPSTQINRAVDAAFRQMEGDDVSPLEYLLGPPKK